MFTPASALHVHENQRERLTYLAKAGKTPQKIACRARIVLMAGEGRPNHAIARSLGVSRPTVLLWRGRFAARGVPSIMKDAARPGRRKAIDGETVKRVVRATLRTTPPGATHWSVRSMAAAQGLSRTTVHRI